MNSIQNLRQFEKLSLLALVFIITLIILSTFSSRFISKAHIQSQNLYEHATKQRLLLEKINQKSSSIITEINYPSVDKELIRKIQLSIKKDINHLKSIQKNIYIDQKNSANYTFSQDIQEQILKILELNLQSFINEIETLITINPDKQEEQLDIRTAINLSSTTSQVIIHSLDYLTIFIQEKIRQNTSTLEMVYTGLNIVTLISVIILGKYLLYPSIKNIQESLQCEKQQAILLEKLANTDRLTGVGNRQKMDDFFKQFKNQSTPPKLTLALLDLNKFKPVNDTYGHSIGDELLVHISKQLQLLESKNTAVYRIGGDEFCLISTGDFTEDSLEKMAKAIIERIEQPLDTKTLTLQVGASIGIASVTNGNNIDFDALMIDADAAMYRAKAKQNTHTVQLSTYQIYKDSDYQQAYH